MSGRPETKSPEYYAWANMKSRCNDPREKYYGGRGIRVCDRWRQYEHFLADMGRRPSSKHSIDRIDNNKGYSPENCRWATSKEQGLNKSNNRYLTAFGRTQRLSEWATEYGLAYGTLRIRLFRGWTIDDSLTHPRGQCRRAQPKLRRAA